mgnify:CR=1 FL=1
MKKLLLLLLLIPNLVMAENVMYCQDELATGIVKKNGVWKSGNFILERHTIKFNDDYTKSDGFNKTMNCNTPYGLIDKDLIFCISEFQNTTFVYNKITMRYTYSIISQFSYIKNAKDTSSLGAGSCEAF